MSIHTHPSPSRLRTHKEHTVTSKSSVDRAIFMRLAYVRAAVLSLLAGGFLTLGVLAGWPGAARAGTVKAAASPSTSASAVLRQGDHHRQYQLERLRQPQREHRHHVRGPAGDEHADTADADADPPPDEDAVTDTVADSPSSSSTSASPTAPAGNTPSKTPNSPSPSIASASAGSGSSSSSPSSPSSSSSIGARHPRPARRPRRVRRRPSRRRRAHRRPPSPPPSTRSSPRAPAAARAAAAARARVRARRARPPSPNSA